MNFDEFKDAIDDADLTIRRGDRAVEKLAYLMIGRLRLVNTWVLIKLKREWVSELHELIYFEEA